MKIVVSYRWLTLALALLILGVASPLAAADLPLSSEGTPAKAAPPTLKEPVAKAPVAATLQVVGVALRPRDSATTFDYGSGGNIYATANPSGVWNTPLSLPQGAVVSSFRMYYNDTNAGFDCDGWFSAYNLTTQTLALEWGVTSTGSAGQGFADSVTLNHTVDNTNYAYVFNWRPNVANSTMRLAGFQLFYSIQPLNRTVVVPLN
jgi:hypothetical protein